MNTQIYTCEQWDFTKNETIVIEIYDFIIRANPYLGL